MEKLPASIYLLLTLLLVTFQSRQNGAEAGNIQDHFQRLSDHVHTYLGTASRGSSPATMAVDQEQEQGQHSIKDRNVASESESASSTQSPDAAMVQDLLDQNSVVSISLGAIRGQVEQSMSGLNYTAFKGIPYAVAKRFERSTLPPKWEGTRDALNYSAQCPQFSLPHKDIIGDEDCLYMNVFVPTLDRCQNEKVLPTLFHIHGGAFTEGSGEQFNPNYFMDECIVYASINYRLGAFGFLATNDGVIEGNLGMKDALNALKFYRDNAAAFRSDKDQITITGISAGSGIVSHFVAAPAAKGLFARAIAQSGNALNVWGIIRNPSTEAEKLGKFLNCSMASSAELRACILTFDTKTILSFQESSVEAINVPRWKIQKYTVGPVVEPEKVEEKPDYEPFVTKHPYHRFKSGDFNRVPMISGFTKDEGILLQAQAILGNPAALQEINEEFRRVVPIAMLYDRLGLSEVEMDQISDKIREFYFGNRTIGPETSQELIDLHSDAFFVQGVLKANELHAKFAPVYPYVFNYVGPFSLTQLVLKLPKLVVSHGHDAPYFYKTAFSNFPAGSEAEKMSQNLVKMWTHFVKTGEPGPTWTKGVFWKQPTERITFNIDNPASNLLDYLEDRKQFWDSLDLYGKGGA